MRARKNFRARYELFCRCVCVLKYKADNCHKLQNRTKYHQDMKNRVHPFDFFAQTEEHRADGIGAAAGQQPQKSWQGHDGEGLGQE